ncbi:AI-2E family transporter [Pleurocapsales cyanobacterium LEGE 06147]|nr:AI-2E family transporter [Pleurocapsales cyanobacterium LEGE 06147]
MKSIRWLGIVTFLIALYILWQIRQIILLALTAVVLTTVLNRVVRLLHKNGIKRSIAVLLTISFVIVLIVIFILAIAPPLVTQFQELIEQVPLGIQKLSEWFIQWQTQLPDSLLEDLQDSLERAIRRPQPLIEQIWENFFAFFSNILNVILSTLLILVLSLMMLEDPSQYRKAFIQLFPAFLRRRVDRVLTRCEEAIAGWSLGTLFNMSIVTIFTGIGLSILSVPLAWANAFLAGLLTLIPNIGPILSVIPPVILALLITPWKAIAVVVLYILIQQIKNNILTSRVIQRQVSLLPAFALLVQLVFAIFFGFLGLLLALPLAITVQILLQEFRFKNLFDKP